MAMRTVLGLIVPASLALLATWALGGVAGARQAKARPETILISIDGFRPDYRERGVTPTLDALAREGIFAAMRPVFPSKTFPNHWTLVTGLLPDHHGIVANRMVDPEHMHASFTMATDDPWWWQQAEPVWIAAEKAGIPTATMFWPGSNVDFGGIRPHDWVQFNQAVSNRQRVDTVVDWLGRPKARRPRFITLYFDTVDTAGHRFGPDSAEVTRAVAEVDGQIGRLRGALARRHIRANLVVVSDHGMASISADRVVKLAAFANPADYATVEDGAYVTLNAAPGHEAALAEELRHPPPHVTCWPRGTIPTRFRYGANPRVPEFLCVADVGWMILANDSASPLQGGAHGYDNAALQMRALFIAAGPSLRHRARLPDFDNTAIEPLLRDLIGLPAGSPRDGADTPFRAALSH